MRKWILQKNWFHKMSAILFNDNLKIFFIQLGNVDWLGLRLKWQLYFFSARWRCFCSRESKKEHGRHLFWAVDPFLVTNPNKYCLPLLIWAPRKNKQWRPLQRHLAVEKYNSKRNVNNNNDNGCCCCWGSFWPQSTFPYRCTIFKNLESLKCNQKSWRTMTLHLFWLHNREFS